MESKMEKDNPQKESILILGAGLMQKPSILAAKEEGLFVYCVDANPSAAAVPLCDAFKKIDLKEKEAIYEFAKFLKNEKKLSGIFTAGTDFSASVAYATEKLNLKGHSFDSALNASVKSRMRECFKKAGVPSPAFYSVRDDFNLAMEISEKLPFPFVVKPSDNMGARGCRMVRSRKEAAGAIKLAFDNSRTKTIIIEEYMEGPEFSIDAIIYEGTLTVTGFADRHIFYPPYFIEMGHTIPSCIDEKKRLELISTFALGVKALNLTEGAAKADIKYTAQGPQIGEIAARLSGGYMSGWTFPYSSDFSLTREAIKISVGRVPEKLLEKRVRLDCVPPKTLENSKDFSSPFKLFEIPSVHVSAERAWISIPGKVRSIEKLGEKKSFDVKDVFPRTVEVGDEVDFPRNNVQKCGNSISLSNDYEKAVAAAEKSSASVLIRLQKNNSRTDDFLSDKEAADEKGFPPSAFSAYAKIKELELSGTMDVSQSVVENAPEEIKEFLELPEKNWNYRTAKEEAELFNRLNKTHKKIERKTFWNALFKGGIQAALYVVDSVQEM